MLSRVMLFVANSLFAVDFGLAADFNTVTEEVHLCGSPFWMPPEMIAHRPHSFPADIWSFAVCLVEMIMRKIPLSNSRFKVNIRACGINQQLIITLVYVPCSQ